MKQSKIAFHLLTAGCLGNGLIATIPLFVQKFVVMALVRNTRGEVPALRDFSICEKVFPY
jgi:hypothetical protein